MKWSRSSLSLDFVFQLGACEIDPTKSADECDIESEIIEPAGVVWLIDPDVVIEDSQDQGKRCDPSMPDS